MQTARREAFEEIGLPLDTPRFPPPFSIEHLTELPLSLAVTNLWVRPCVAFLHDDSWGQRASVEESLIPKLDPKEVQSVFTVPLERFLTTRYGGGDGDGADPEKKDGVQWYRGAWLPTYGGRWK